MKTASIERFFSLERPALSFEIFPPKTSAGWKNLYRTVEELDAVVPAYFSITYGAGGGGRERSFRLISEMNRISPTPMVAHLTCFGHSRLEITEIISRYEEAGVQNILALLGDSPLVGKPPAGQKVVQSGGREGRQKTEPGIRHDFLYAKDLVTFISCERPAIGVGVAGFPEGHHCSLNRIKEIEFLKEKVDAGADYIVTQLFFDNRDYVDFVRRCRLAGITVPIIPGIMPILSRSNMLRMADLAPRCRFPADLLGRIEACRDDREVAGMGIEWAIMQAKELIRGGVPGLHIYTLNRFSAGLEIARCLEPDFRACDSNVDIAWV